MLHDYQKVTNAQYMNILGKSQNFKKMPKNSEYIQGMELPHETFYKDYQTPINQALQILQQSQKIQSFQYLNQAKSINGSMKKNQSLVVNPSLVQHNFKTQQNYKNQKYGSSENSKLRLKRSNSLRKDNQYKQKFDIQEKFKQNLEKPFFNKINVNGDQLLKDQQKQFQSQNSNDEPNQEYNRDQLLSQSSNISINEVENEHSDSQKNLQEKQIKLIKQLMDEKFSNTNTKSWVNTKSLPPYNQNTLNKIFIGGYKKRLKANEKDDIQYKVRNQGNFQIPVYFYRDIKTPISQKKSLSEIKNNKFNKTVVSFNHMMQLEKSMFKTQQRSLYQANSNYQNRELQKIDYYFEPPMVKHDAKKVHKLQKKPQKTYDIHNMWPQKFKPQSKQINSLPVDQKEQKAQNIKSQDIQIQKSGTYQNIRYTNLENSLNNQYKYSKFIQDPYPKKLNKAQSLIQMRREYINQGMKKDLGLSGAQINIDEMYKYDQLRDSEQKEIQEYIQRAKIAQLKYENEQQSKQQFGKLMGKNKQLIAQKKRKKFQDHLQNDQKSPFQLQFDDMVNFSKAKKNLESFYNTTIKN